MEQLVTPFLIVFTLAFAVFIFSQIDRDPRYNEREINPARSNFLRRDESFNRSHIHEKSLTINYPKLRPNPYRGSYPTFSSLLQLLELWNPDISIPPRSFNESLMHFNYSNPQERKAAELYRKAELPFKIYGISEIDQAVKKWGSEDYLLRNLDGFNYIVEESETNHFMYWNKRTNASSRTTAASGGGDVIVDKTAEGDVEVFIPPTKNIAQHMNFKEWNSIARLADDSTISANGKYYYFMTASGTEGGNDTFIAQDLPIFSTRKNTFFVSNVRQNKGIQCRFGMRGIVAEAHYDNGRNMVAMLKGEKRYLLTPPWTCKKLAIISDTDHPSYRHSIIDWSDVQQAMNHGFDNVDAVETILRAGEVLYIPSYWFHYIVSLRYSIQCNTRSGKPPNREGAKYIRQCLGTTKGKKKSSRERKELG